MARGPFVEIVAAPAALAVIRFMPLVASKRPPAAVKVVPLVREIVLALELSDMPLLSLKVELAVTAMVPPVLRASEVGLPPIVS